MAPRDDSLDSAVIALVLVGTVVLTGGLVVGSFASGAGGGFGAASAPDDTSQKNPQDIESHRDLSAVERQLASQAAERIRSGEIDLSDEDVEGFQGSLSESEFDALVEQYAEIADETDSEDRAAVFLRIRSDRREYASATAEYRRLYRVYNGTADYDDPETQALLEDFEFVSAEEPTTDGGADRRIDLNETQERELAQHLETRWHRVNHTADRLIDGYRELETIDGESYEEGIESVEESRANISARHRTIRDEWFVRLDLTAGTADPRGSFDDPIRVSGRLTAPDGTPYQNETARLRINDQPTDIETNATGHYTAEYRPATVRQNATEVTVQIVPTTEAMVVGLSRPSVPVTIVPTTPTVSVSTPRGSVGFNETLAVTGRVGSTEAGAANVSYRLLVGGDRLASGRTNETGHVNETMPLPADVPAGDRDVRLAVGRPDRALLPANGTTTVRVRERPTELSVEADQTADRTLSISGELAVPDGPGAPGRPVEIRVNETGLGTTTTGANGTFETSVVVPESATEGDPFQSVTALSIEAVYEDGDANLGRSTASTTTLLTAGTLWGWLAAAGIVAVILLGIGVGWMWWRREQPASIDGFEEPTGWSAAVPEGSSAESLLDRARNALLEDRAVVAAQLAYAALRTHLEAEYGGETAQTHWEFYRRCQEAGDDDTLATLRDVTEVYERVVFAADSVSAETVAPVIDRTERLVATDAGP